MNNRTVYSIKDDGDLRKYYTQIPNIIDDSDLSVYAIRLYLHLKRVAGEYGDCYQSTSTLAKACRMSAGSVVKAKEELQKKGFIQIDIIKGEHGEFDRHNITIVDVWNANFRSYSPGEQDAFTTRTGAYHHVNRSVSPREPKNNPIKNNTIKNNTRGFDECEAEDNFTDDSTNDFTDDFTNDFTNDFQEDRTINSSLPVLSNEISNKTIDPEAPSMGSGLLGIEHSKTRLKVSGDCLPALSDEVFNKTIDPEAPSIEEEFLAVEHSKPRPKVSENDYKMRIINAMRKGVSEYLERGYDIGFLRDTLRPYAEAFLSVMGEDFAPLKRDQRLWINVLSEWEERGYTPDDVIRTIEYMRRKDLIITSPASLTKSIAHVRATREKPIGVKYYRKEEIDAILGQS